MKNYIFLTTIVLFSVLFSNTSYALGKMGHKLACQIAYDLLPVKDKKAVDGILANLPEKYIKAINKYNYQAVDTPIDFATSCTWADAVKNEKKFKKYKSWHYINIDRTAERVSAKSCKKRCVTIAIPYHFQQLNRISNKKKRAEALMFLGHWVGDIHQPLHVSFASDFGGNKRKIEPLVGKCSNLHWYWDQCLLFPSSGVKLEKSQDYRDLYLSLYTELNQDLGKAPLNDWLKTNTDGWADESFQLVRHKDFNYCQQESGRCITLGDEPIVITKAYHDKYRAILKERILQASLRLSVLINTALKD